MYHGDIRLGDTIDIKFTTRQISGAPFTLAGTPVVSAYVGNGTTEITAGITLTVDFDARTGLNNVRVVASSGNGFATATNVQLVITTGTVNGVSVVGEVIGSFSIEARSAIMPTTAARTLDVTATGEAGLDFANIGAPAAGAVPVLGMIDNGTAQSATGTTLVLRAAAAFATSELVGAVIVITGGTTGVGQVRQITAYNGGTDTATVDAWTTTPTGTITYAIFAAPPASATPPSVNVTQWLGSAVATPTVAGVPEVDVTHVGGTAQTAGDIITQVNAVKTKTDFLPSATAGSAGGLVIDGVNSGAASFTAGLTISNAAGSALTLNSSGGNGSGLEASGNGTGDGIMGTGGATGRGLHARGGVTSGAGILAEARADNSNGISATGFGSGDGFAVTGGPTGHGIHGIGGATSGAGMTVEGSAGNANGLECIANGSGIDLAADNLAAILATTDKLDTTVQAQSGLVSGYRFSAEALSLAPSGSGPTVAQIVDGVWDEPISGHLTSGSTGAALNGAGAAGDPWTTPLPGAYGAGTAGFIVGTNVDAAVSAVKAKTDNLPTDPADESLVIAATDAIFNRIGAPAGASVSADVAAVNAKTTNLPSDPADESLIIAATDAIMTRLGLPAGVSVSADVAAVLASVGLRLLTSAYTAPLDAAGTRTAVGLASANLDTQLGTLATAAALATTDGKATAIQAKTDSLVFTVAGQVDANVQYVNDAQVTGNGQPGTEWGPV